MLNKIDHIGIAVADLEKAITKYEILTGKPVADREIVEEQRVSTAFFPVGESRLELLASLDESSPITAFLQKRGEGIHHICFAVDDLVAARQALAASGFQFIESVGQAGAGGSKVAFIHPKSAGGILIELVEHPPQ